MELEQKGISRSDFASLARLVALVCVTLGMELVEEPVHLTPSASLVLDPKLRNSLLSELDTLFRFKSERDRHDRRDRRVCKSFPGQHPISINRDEIARLRGQKCMVTLKSDGIRYLLMLCCVDGDFRAVMIDRRLQIYEIVVWAEVEYFERGTLLDGELVLDHQTGRLNFQVFDAIRVQGIACHDLPYCDRLQKLHDHILCDLPDDLDDRTVEAEEFIIDENKIYAPESNYLRLRLAPKRFVPLDAGKDLWEMRHSHPFPSDGLIIYMNSCPIQTGTSRNMLKWKPHNVVDVFVSKSLQVACRSAGRVVKLDQLTFDGVVYKVSVTANHLTECLTHRDQHEDARWTLECLIELHKSGVATLWPMRERVDKAEANDLKVIHATLQTICESVELDEVLDDASDCRSKSATKRSSPETSKSEPAVATPTDRNGEEVTRRGRGASGKREKRQKRSQPTTESSPDAETLATPFATPRATPRATPLTASPDPSIKDRELPHARPRTRRMGQLPQDA